MNRGNCYAASEALYHLIGGKKAGWKPCRIVHMGVSHWYLRHKTGLILDATVHQFPCKPEYERGKGCGFLTSRPSKRGKRLMEQILWAN